MASSVAICRRQSLSPVSDAIDTTVVFIVHLRMIHDGRVRRVKYKGHDGRVRNIHQKQYCLSYTVKACWVDYCRCSVSVKNIYIVMSSDGVASLSSRTSSTVCQAADFNADPIVLDKDTYLIDENNRVIPIPAGTVAVLDRDSGKGAAAANVSTDGDVEANVDAVTPSVINAESVFQATNMPADSTSMVSMSHAAAVTHSSESVVSTACEVVEATSSDPNPSISLSDMFVQEEEEVTDEPKDQETIISGSRAVEGSTKSPSKDAGRKPSRRGTQKTSHKMLDEGQVDSESKDHEAVVSVAEPVKGTTKSRSKDARQKPRSKGAQKKMPDESQVDDGAREIPLKQEKCSVPVAAMGKPSLVAEITSASSAPTSPAVPTVSASGRPQRSTPRRSVFEMLHGAELKPQRQSHASMPDSEQESSSSKGHSSKKRRVSKSGTADDQERKQPEEMKVVKEPQRQSHTALDSEQESSGGKSCHSKKRKVSESGTANKDEHKQLQGTEGVRELGTSQSKGRQQQHSGQSTFQTPVSSDGCEASNNCDSLDTASCVSKTSCCLPSTCIVATGCSDLVQLPSDGLENSIEKMDVDGLAPQNKYEKLGDDVANLSEKKQKQSKKAALSKRSDSAAVEKGGSKKVVGKRDLGSKSAKIKATKKPQVTGDDSKVADDVDDFKMPGMPYDYFTVDSSDHMASDSDDDSSSSDADDLASEDVDWMRQRIVELEQEVRSLKDGCVQDNRQKSRCWQDVLAEVSDLPSEDIDEKLMLTHYERKLRVLDRELEERASFIRIREGCIARRERRILEKESKLKRQERELEHQRCLHGRVKLASESAADSNTLSTGFVDSSSEPNRKQALEKEVRLELQKQELNRQKHVLDDTRKKLAAKERELENREQALVDADLLNMASEFASSRGTEANHPNGGTNVEFSDDDDDDFGGNSLSTFGANSVTLPFSLDKDSCESVDDQKEVSYVHTIC